MQFRRLMSLFVVLIFAAVFVTTNARPSYAAATCNYTITEVEILDSNGNTICGAQQTENSGNDPEGTFTYSGSGDPSDPCYLRVTQSERDGYDGELLDGAQITVPISSGSVEDGTN